MQNYRVLMHSDHVKEKIQPSLSIMNLDITK